LGTPEHNRRVGKLGGRPKGAKNKLTVEKQRAGWQFSGMEPLEFLVSEYQNESNSKELRHAAANAAAPYIHRKQPRIIDITAQINLPAPIIHVHKIALGGGSAHDGEAIALSQNPPTSVTPPSE